jgi:hypothetical protein
MFDNLEWFTARAPTRWLGQDLTVYKPMKARQAKSRYIRGPDDTVATNEGPRLLLCPEALARDPAPYSLSSTQKDA